MQFKRNLIDGYNKIKCKWLDIPIISLFAVLVVMFISECIAKVMGTQAGFVHTAFFPVMSLFANLIIFKMIQVTMQISNVCFNEFHIATMCVIYAVVVILYFAFILNREFIYYWDYGNYLIKQYDMEEAFHQGLRTGVSTLLHSLTQDYTNFISVFTEFPFCLTNRTGDSYVLSQLINIFLPILLLLSTLVLKFQEIFNVHNQKFYYVVSLCALAYFPLLHDAALLGMPDWFGIVFCLIVVLLTIDYKFEKVDLMRYVMLFISTAALVLVRRWYLYFIVGYYVAYSVYVLSDCIRLYHRKEKDASVRQLKNILIFGIVSVVLMGIIFYKIIMHIFGYDYAERYAAYNAGGLASEIDMQLLRVSIYIIFILIGVISALIKHRNVRIVAVSSLGLLLSIVLFTRVQNMGNHQSLLLLPYYFVLIMSGFAAIFGITKQSLFKIGAVLSVICVAVSPLCCRSAIVAGNILVKSDTLLKIYPSLKLEELKSTSREGFEKIRNVADWINDNCDDGEHVYIIPHDDLYNPDLFKNVNLPDRSVCNKISFGFGVVGTHKFPTDLFDAKYVLTCVPYPNVSPETAAAQKLHNAFMDYSKNTNKFKVAETFDMGNGYVFYAYKRVVEVDCEETEYYLNVFAEEDAKFPDLYSQVIEHYVADNNL